MVHSFIHARAHARAVASSRRHSEDRAEILARGDALVVVVADGAGGMRGGAAASDALVLATRAAVANDAFDLENLHQWSDLLARTDATLATAMTGETTAVVVILTPRGLRGVSTGDSEAWVVSATSIDHLTADQTAKRLGSGRAVPTTFSRAALDGALVVGTDGLFKYASAEAIAQAVRGRAASDAAATLTALVRLPSGSYHDDVGIVVVEAAH